ncbi:MAG: DUF3368 domain-containing protein [Chitinivibrionales bacterium]|nr:DUF3368 domain-containing protein [Chitinivibrionales bacterium]
MRKHLFVFDTVSLANFLLSDADKILTARYSGRAFITEQVFDELTSGMRMRPRLALVDSLLKQNHFDCITLTAPEHTRYADLIANLGKGEASCIAAAWARGWTVVTDDRAARGHGAEMGLAVTGTIGILKAACREKQVTASVADHILQAMIDNGFYAPVRRISDLL